MKNRIFSIVVIVMAVALIFTASCCPFTPPGPTPTATAPSGTTDYDESFYYVTESFPSSGEVCLEMDVDTTGGYVTVTVYGELYHADGWLVDSAFTTWTIHSDDVEYGPVCLVLRSGGAGMYDYYLELYDDLGIYEGFWSGTVYLSP